ncbi:MAG: 2Fe-2S iron-sulfur cluster-binding protein [Bacteroidales bacterium]|jgi:predicted molibdopterin-dependent oxidoreductase YjgC
MVKLKIDNTEYEAPEELTILDVAIGAGFNIPTLCHNNNLPHYSSCMVCMVKDNRTGNFLPSCSAFVQEGMDIAISDEVVISLRRKAIELLLSEHRAECEAPCRVVCPGGYNIPLMNRLLSANDFKAAIQLSIAQLQSSELKCIDCPGYCENACRRKKIDIPVSIRNIQLFVSQQTNYHKTNLNIVNNPNNEIVIKTGIKTKNASKRFTSHIGKLEATELKEWLKECDNEVKRVREISDLDAASNESESCMHCDCRAADNCRLRDLADEFSIKDPRDKLINSPIVKKINRNTGLIFENAKCIKCGLCVRLCEDSKDEPALCFINRGFVSIISEPLTEDFNNILKSKSKEVIEICPTGALSKLK